jgi:hypothetical protein
MHDPTHKAGDEAPLVAGPGGDTRLPAPKTWDEYFEGVKRWLDDRWGEESPVCQSCKDPGRTWIVGEALGLFTSPGWPPFEQPGVTPMVPVSCYNCGHTVFVRALLIFRPQETGLQGGEDGS